MCPCHTRPIRANVAAGVVAALAIGLMSACTGETTLERLTEASRLSSDVLVQFLKAADAGNRAVMANSDETTAALAKEADEATEAVQQDVEALRAVLTSLGLSEELDLLTEFDTMFAKYRELDRQILALVVEGTNLKAQRLSFGEAQMAADALVEALDGVGSPDAAAEGSRARALAATVVARTREIQVLQAPHIAEPDEAKMTALEARMAAAETAARDALEALGQGTPPSSPRVAAAAQAFDRFMALNAQILVLSRRNSNVRSLALSLNQKRTAIAACEDSLRALQASLAGRGFTGTR
jgi:hypothetical protein